MNPELSNPETFVRTLYTSANVHSFNCLSCIYSCLELQDDFNSGICFSSCLTVVLDISHFCSTLYVGLHHILLVTILIKRVASFRFSDPSPLPENFTTMAHIRKLDIIDQVKALLIHGKSGQFQINRIIEYLLNSYFCVVVRCMFA